MSGCALGALGSPKKLLRPNGLHAHGCMECSEGRPSLYNVGHCPAIEKYIPIFLDESSSADYGITVHVTLLYRALSGQIERALAHWKVKGHFAE